MKSTINKRRAGAELKQKLKGKRSDGMGEYTATIYGMDDGKRVELKGLNDLNKYSEFELDESVVNEGKTSAVYTDPKTGKGYDLQYVSSKKRWELDIMKKGASIYSNAITTIKRNTLAEIQEWLDGYKIDSNWTKGLSESVTEAKGWNAVAKVMDAALKKANVSLSYAKEYAKSLEGMAKRDAKEFFADYGDMTEEDFIEDVEYNMRNESVTEAKFNKKKLMKAMKKDDGVILVGGKEYIVYKYDNGNDDNDEMWQDDAIFALDQDGEEHEIKYSDIERYSESVVTESLTSNYQVYSKYVRTFESINQSKYTNLN